METRQEYVNRLNGDEIILYNQKSCFIRLISKYYDRKRYVFTVKLIIGDQEVKHHLTFQYASHQAVPTIEVINK